MKKLKKHFLAATLVLALGAAVYLNWSLSTTKQTSKVLGESKYVNATLTTETVANKSKSANTATQKTSNSKSKTDTTSSSQKSKSTENNTSKLSAKELEFFAQAETKRKQTQDEIIDKANQILELESTSENERTEAQLQVAGVIKNFTLQDTIETTLVAKGLSKAICYVNDQGCIVGVLKSELNDSTTMIIKATVQSVTNIDFDKITIITV
ncbi:MAG: SpoIIIAH-like family protein [Ruminococcus sp.]